MSKELLLAEQTNPNLNERKRRLFACACCRATGLLDAEPACLAAIEVAERYADRLATGKELQTAREAARMAHVLVPALAWLAEAVVCACGRMGGGREEFFESLDHAARAARDAAREMDWRNAKRAQGDLFRDVVAVPSPLPVVEPGWLRANEGAVAKLAGAIYQDLSFADLPVLADALEEAGCDNAHLLVHCRAANRHVRGCWALDALLGKE